jgi:hypothetical protein
VCYFEPRMSMMTWALQKNVGQKEVAFIRWCSAICLHLVDLARGAPPFMHGPNLRVMSEDHASVVQLPSGGEP